MKSRMMIAVMLVCGSVFIPASVISAAGGFTETLKEKLVCASGSTCTVVRTGKFKISGQVFENENLEASEFNESSVVHVELGDLSYDGTLGDDPNYVAGGKSATFVLTSIDSDTGKTLTDVKITLKKGSSGLKISVTGKISDTQSPILADNYIGLTGAINDATSAFVQVGSHIEDRNVAITGTASVKAITKNGQTYNLSSIKIKGQ